MFKDPKPNEIENWSCVLETSTEFEAEMAKNYLNSLKIPSNILSKRDSAYSLNVGDMARVYLYVPTEFEGKARQAIEQWQSDESGEEE